MMYYGTFIVEREVNFCACYVEKNCKKGNEKHVSAEGPLAHEWHHIPVFMRFGCE